MANRSGPSDGYRAGFKPMWRKQVWRTLTDGMADKANLQVLMMPSIEGDEIAWAETKGIKRQNIHVVDHNRAIVATLQRKYPGIKTYGVDLFKAAEKMLQDGVSISIANIDLCCQVHDEMLMELRLMFSNGLFASPSRVAVNVQRGREGHDAVGTALRGLKRDVDRLNYRYPGRAKGGIKVTDDFRLDLIEGCFTGGWPAHEDEPAIASKYMPRRLRMGIYKSSAGSLTFLWTAVELHWTAAESMRRRTLQELIEQKAISHKEMNTSIARAIAGIGGMLLEFTGMISEIDARDCDVSDQHGIHELRIVLDEARKALNVLHQKRCELPTDSLCRVEAIALNKKTADLRAQVDAAEAALKRVEAFFG